MLKAAVTPSAPETDQGYDRPLANQAEKKTPRGKKEMKFSVVDLIHARSVWLFAG